MANNKSIIAAYKRMFNSEDGKIILNDLKNRTGFDKSVVSFDNTNATFYRAGMHDMIKGILLRVNLTEEQMNNLNNINNEGEI